MHPHSFVWFDMVEASFPVELWYSNFRVTRGTFIYILHETVMRYLNKTLQCESCYAKKLGYFLRWSRPA